MHFIQIQICSEFSSWVRWQDTRKLMSSNGKHASRSREMIHEYSEYVVLALSK
jgi:hypothetical protein